MKIMVKVVFAVLAVICLFALLLPAAASEPASNSSQAPTGPARIELRADRSHVTADDVDHIKLTAFVYNAQGNPVADGYKINFTIGSATDNNFTSNGNFEYVPGAMGRLGSLDNPNNFYQGTTGNNSGSASVQFGWIDELYSGNNSTVWAYSADNAGVFASIKIYSAAPTASWTGYIVDSSGAGIGGVPVTMHIVGMNGSTPYEIYNMTRTTDSSQPFVGHFAFDYIVLHGPVYGYVDAEAQSMNRTVYGKSGNFSMDQSATSIGNITLAIPLSDSAKATSVASPSTMARPSPGFEIPLELAGCLGVAYLMARRGEF